MRNLTNRSFSSGHCDLVLPSSYELNGLITHISLACVGLFYGILGYRCWRLTLFLTSFALGSVVVFLILSRQLVTNELQLISISCSIAILFGLINILLQYVGLFVNGFCFGLILSILTFIIWDIINHAHGITTSIWLLIGLILIFGLTSSVLALSFQKFMLIISSSCLAGICHMLVLDYFIQLSSFILLIHKRLQLISKDTLCIHHWIIVFILPIVMLLSIVIQYSCTGRNYDHRDSLHRMISAGNKHYKTANLQKIRRHYEQDTLRQQIMPDETNRFRYLYQVRRANGDALSSDFIKNLRQQNSTVVRLNNNNTTSTITPPTRKNADSTTTTLTHLL